MAGSTSASLIKAGEAYVPIRLDTAPLNRSLKDVGNLFGKYFSSRRLFKWGLISTGAGAALLATLRGITASFAAAADQSAKFAKRIGINANSLDQLTFAAERTGVQSKDLTKGLERMGRRVSEVATQDTGQAQEALEQLGLSAEKLVEKPMDKMFMGIIRGIKGLSNQSERLSVVADIFGRGSMAMAQLANIGVPAIQRLMGVFEETRGTTNYKLAEKYQDTAENMRRAWEGLRNELGETYAPALIKIMEKMESAMIRMRKAQEKGGFWSKVAAYAPHAAAGGTAALFGLAGLRWLSEKSGLTAVLEKAWQFLKRISGELKGLSKNFKGLFKGMEMGKAFSRGVGNRILFFSGIVQGINRIYEALGRDMPEGGFLTKLVNVFSGLYRIVMMSWHGMEAFSHWIFGDLKKYDEEMKKYNKQRKAFGMEEKTPWYKGFAEREQKQKDFLYSLTPGARLKSEEIKALNKKPGMLERLKRDYEGYMPSFFGITPSYKNFKPFESGADNKKQLKEAAQIEKNAQKESKTIRGLTSFFGYEPIRMKMFGGKSSIDQKMLRETQKSRQHLENIDRAINSNDGQNGNATFAEG